MNEAREQHAMERTEIEPPARRRPDLDIKTLALGDVIHLRTRNTDYRLRVVDPARARAVVEGGSVFPEATAVDVLGACRGGAIAMEAGQVSIGCALLLLRGGSWVRLSTVRSVSVERAEPSRHGRTAPSPGAVGPSGERG